jgi:hypothetical protein
MKNNDYLIEVMSLVGFSIVQLQRVESVLAASWLLYARLENEAVPGFVFDGDFTELEQRNSKKMLGGFLKDIKSSGQFRASFNRRFEKFVNNRNRLVHRMFKERAYKVLGKKRTLLQLHRFVSNLLREAVFFEKVLDGYLGVSFEALAARKEFEVKGVDLLKDLMAEKRSRGELDLVRQAIKMR